MVLNWPEELKQRARRRIDLHPFGLPFDHLIDAYAAVLPKALPTRFGFFGTIVSAKMIPRQQRGITLINSAFDESGFSFLEG